MTLSKTQTQDIIKKFGSSPTDSGSSAVQVALLTERLAKLNEHFKTNKHDHHSRVGLMKIVGQRKKLLRYLQQQDTEAYRDVIAKLGLRK